MTNDEWTNELYHHGIFGQKWGKRNGPPYPLKPGKHSAREKRLGWRKSLRKGQDSDVPEQKKSRGVDWDKHPDSKYFDSRKFGTDDLDRLTARFNSEKAFNDALAAKLRSENMLDADKYKSMSRKQKRELYQKITEMESDAEYYNAYQRQVQSQVNLIESQKRLAELTKKPDSAFKKARKAVGGMLVDMGKQSIKNVGTEAMTYMLGTSVNKIAGTQVINVNKQKEDLAMKELKRKTDNLTAQYNYQKAKRQLDEENASNYGDITRQQYDEARKLAEYHQNLKKVEQAKHDIKGMHKEYKEFKDWKKQNKKNKKNGGGD